MLVTTKELLCIANAENKAIGAFNITGLETLQAVLQAAESKKEPVILQFAQVHEEEHIMSLDIIGPIMIMMADQATVPVAVHLDHGVDLHILKKALDMGFTSIMYDGSSLPYGENIAYTRMAVSMAKEYGASVEAEIGQMAGVTLNDQKITENRKIDRSMFTDPLIAQDFVEKTGVDCLACAFGTVHGLYATKPCLDYELVKELDAAIGVRKVNYYTYMAKSGGEAAREYAAASEPVYFHDLANAAIAAMCSNVEEALRIFAHHKEQ